MNPTKVWSIFDMHAPSMSDDDSFGEIRGRAGTKPAVTLHTLPEFNDKPTFKDKPTAKEVWFTGCHGDVGGGNAPAEDSGLAAIALNWMKDEACDVGLLLGQNVTRPSPSYRIHDSMQGAWPLLELPPRINRLREFNDTSPVRGLLANTVIWATTGYVLWSCLKQITLFAIAHSLGSQARHMMWRILAGIASLVCFIFTYKPEKISDEYENGGGSRDSFYDRLPTGIRMLLWSVLAQVAGQVLVHADSVVSPLIASWFQDHTGTTRTTVSTICAGFSAVFAISFWSDTYMPLAEPRPMASDDKVHWSVLQRLIDDPTYRPINVLTYLKATCGIEPNEVNHMTFVDLKDKVKSAGCLEE